MRPRERRDSGGQDFFSRAARASAGRTAKLRTGLSRPSIRSPFAAPISAGKRFGEARDRAGFFGDDCIFCTAETGRPRVSGAKAPEVKVHSDGPRKPSLRGTGWWGWQDLNRPPTDYGPEGDRIDGRRLTGSAGLFDEGPAAAADPVARRSGAGRVRLIRRTAGRRPFVSARWSMARGGIGAAAWSPADGTGARPGRGRAGTGETPPAPPRQRHDRRPCGPGRGGGSVWRRWCEDSRGGFAARARTAGVCRSF